MNASVALKVTPVLHQEHEGVLSIPRMNTSLARKVTAVLQEVILFMHLEKTAGTLVRTWMTSNGWAHTGYCNSADGIPDQAIRLLESNEMRIFVEHHCGIDW
mmetsp:Transcript_46401/g.121789  ORF Transcript_46401/g.121789 Transcript_46401/m.121789 type:complete len:102 (+) Transcript_46401:754-1059(+)